MSICLCYSNKDREKCLVKCGVEYKPSAASSQNIFGQKNYCHEHGKYHPCERCNDSLIDAGIQLDKDRIAELERRLAERPDLTAIVRSSIVAYNEGRAGNPYHPGYTEHERIAWEAGHSAGGWGGKC